MPFRFATGRYGALRGWVGFYQKVAPTGLCVWCLATGREALR
jgi:hypothetical protein